MGRPRLRRAEEGEEWGGGPVARRWHSPGRSVDTAQENRRQCHRAGRAARPGTGGQPPPPDPRQSRAGGRVKKEINNNRRENEKRGGCRPQSGGTPLSGGGSLPRWPDLSPGPGASLPFPPPAAHSPRPSGRCPLPFSRAPRRSRSGGRPPGGLGPAAASPPRCGARSVLWGGPPLPPPPLPAARVGTAGRAERQFILICLIVRSSRAIIPYNFRNKQV